MITPPDISPLFRHFQPIIDAAIGFSPAAIAAIESLLIFRLSGRFDIFAAFSAMPPPLAFSFHRLHYATPGRQVFRRRHSDASQRQHSHFADAFAAD